jgi:hypothetical protein
VAHAQASAATSAAATEKLAWWSVTRPQKAGIFSALLPGAGQVYNGQAWKAPLVAGALAGSLYVEVRYWQLYQEYKAGYKARLQASRGNIAAVDRGPRSGKEPSNAAQLYRFRSYRTSRDLWLGLNAVVYGLQILDAVSIAHLHDFDISENLTLRCQPTALPLASSGWAPGLQVALAARPSNRSF